MLAELAAANAAFSIIKQAISNGSELAAAGKQVADFAVAKQGLQKKINKKKGGGDGSDLAEFMALEQIKQKENELREIMIWAGRPGLWKDWQAFQANATAARSAAQKKADAKSAVMRDRIKMAIAAILFIFIVGGILGGAFYMKMKGLI